MDSLSFGRYIPYNTIVPRLDPRSKTLFLILLMVAIFMPFSLWSTSIVFSFVHILFVGVIMAISHVSFIKLFKSLKAMWVMILFLLLIYVFVPNNSYTMPAIDFGNGYIIYYDGLLQCFYIVLRLILILSITMVLTSTSKPLDLTFAFEWYMTPLKLIKFPVHIIAMMLSIALRFIPTILDEANRIMKAQESRGVDFSKGGLFKRFKALISLFIPLIVSAFDRSEQLADAMESRGYDPKGKRSRYRVLKFGLRDLISLLIVVIYVAGIMYLSIAHNNLDLIKLIFNVEVGF